MIRGVNLPKAVVGVMLILLPVFAYLQYDWLGKVSDSERKQMQASLERSVTEFRDEFDREIGRVYSHFQIEDSAAEAEPAARYAALYNEWLKVAPYPGLISELFLAMPDDNQPRRKVSLQRLQPETGAFAETEWPAAFANFKNALMGELRPTGTTGTNRGLFVTFAPRSIDSSIPALFIPVARAPFLAPEPFELMHPRAYLIAKLNIRFIRDEFLPALVRTHFPEETGADYSIAIVDRTNPQQPLFGAASANAEGDVSTQLFSQRVLEFQPVRTAAFAFAGPLPAPGARVSRRTLLSESVQVRVLQQGGAREGRTSFPSDSGGWRLIATHRAGSLDAAVSQIRRRNLGISAGTLLLLAGSVTMIVFSSQRAQRLARQQMEFVSTVSHELRTPLAVICSAGENLADGVVENAAQARQYGAVVRNEGRRLAEMVEQVLDFAGMESGRRSYTLRPTDVGDVVQAALESCSLQIRDKGFVVETRIDGPPPIMADKPALARAIQNLVSNALKYSDASRWVRIAASRTNGGAAIEVEDKGTGIPASEIAHIFEPFYRGRAAMDAQINGSGLGLSLVKQIVEAHGGSVSVHTAVGSGTTFRIDLPASSAVLLQGRSYKV